LSTPNSKTVREIAENDLEAFIRLVSPTRALGQCHVDLIRWWTREDAKSHQLVLLPRDHQKSALIAYRVAWSITRDPTLRVLYISATSNLAEKQLKMIKDILTCDKYRKYWPEMVNADEAKREKWTTFEISVDDPRRKAALVRDPTIFTAGLTTTIVGMHCDIAVLDDVVIDDTAYTNQGRDKVRSQAGYLASIAGTEAQTWSVGTRYHPLDLYNDFKTMVVELRNDEGDIVSSDTLYEIYEKTVEDNGDGTGNFLWPRMQNSTGKWFGFDQKQLAIKKAQYYDQTKFRAQYYNDPNDLSTATITPSMFQYYNPKMLRQEGLRWYYKDQRLNIFAAVDFAYSLSKKADYTAITVVGVSANNTYYVLDIERFKTQSISEYYDRILRLHGKWGFNKLRAEVTAAQVVIVKDLQENYIRANGLALSIDEFRPTRHGGSKEERIEAILQPRYANKQIWHYSGGHCTLLEEELVMQKPPHDDIKDCLASCIDCCVAPTSIANSNPRQFEQRYHSRFGGIG
jgi:phage terminase large subunit-like protein